MKIFLASGTVGLPRYVHKIAPNLNAPYRLDSFDREVVWRREIPTFQTANKLVIVDSGTFTFNTGRTIGSNEEINIDFLSPSALIKADKLFWPYAMKYARFINKYRKQLDICIEMDMGVGYPLEKINHIYKILTEATMGECCIMRVWHPYYGMKIYEEWIEKYPIVAIPSMLLKQDDYGYGKFMGLLETALKKGCRTHILGMANPKYIVKLFSFAYSCDSSTWTSGQKYGFAYKYMGSGKISIYRNRHITKRHYSVALINYLEWVKLANYWERQGVWINDYFPRKPTLKEVKIKDAL